MVVDKANQHSLMISGVDVGGRGGGVGEQGGGSVGGKDGGVGEVAVISGEGQCIGGASSIDKFSNDKPEVEDKGG